MRQYLLENLYEFKLGQSLGVKNALGLILSSGLHNKLRKKVWFIWEQRLVERVVRAPAAPQVIMSDGFPHCIDYQNAGLSARSPGDSAHRKW